ncbi:MAG: DUF2235 domain-containing protein [Cellvibrionaceae bacterium]|nr:DUF2235 domain-containing protein [Cellvibrionaceae bacterium]
MCLFVVDGTWSRTVNYEHAGKDDRGYRIGSKSQFDMSNSRRFYLASSYPENQKFYYGGPWLATMGTDSGKTHRKVLSDIEREIVSGNCTEISLVGWSRGAAIATEVAQALLEKEFARIYKKIPRQTARGTRTNTVIVDEAPILPEIKFLGLFDSVEMIPNNWLSRSKDDKEWGEIIPDKVNHFAHAIAGDRSTAFRVFEYKPRNPLNFAKTSNVKVFPLANHGDIGGSFDTIFGKQAYQFIRSNADKAGVK